MAKPHYLVIVESPSKAKTIGRYLGPGYTVKASMGHLRDLPKSKMGVDLETDFTPQYIPVRGKEALIKELKADAAKANLLFVVWMFAVIMEFVYHILITSCLFVEI